MGTTGRIAGDDHRFPAGDRADRRGMATAGTAQMLHEAGSGFVRFRAVQAEKRRAATRAGRDRRDDVRDLTDEDRLAAFEDNHRFVALGRVAGPTA